jgi:hypothetical protein
MRVRVVFSLVAVMAFMLAAARAGMARVRFRHNLSGWVFDVWRMTFGTVQGIVGAYSLWSVVAVRDDLPRQRLRFWNRRRVGLCRSGLIGLAWLRGIAQYALYE